MADGIGAAALAGARGAVRALDAALWLFIRFWRAILIAGVAAGACVVLVLGVATWEVARGLPEDPATLMDGREAGSVTVLDRDGSKLGMRGQRFQRLTTEKAGKILIDAVLATEDRRFFWHIGVDPIGLARAMLVNWRAGRIEQGGSSITQQVAKLAFTSQERVLERKLRELPFALALEWRYSKSEILSIYLNRAYLGGGAYGFEAAARFYFGKAAERLSHAEAALLAGLLRAPSKWSPTSDFSAAQSRARVILDAMLDAEKIDAGQHAVAVADVAALAPPTITETAPHFVDWVTEQIPPSFWSKASDLVITTTLDRSAQAIAEAAIRDTFAKDVERRDRDAEASLVVLARDGAVQAMVGGRDYARSQFNRAASARRQLGSAFKPFVYAAALERGYGPSSIVRDAPITIAGWSPQNYSRSYRGEMTLRSALARSSNVVAVRLAQSVGIDSVVAMARRFGFADDIPPYPSLALGTLGTNPLEVASAYATFARNGLATPAYAITEIRGHAGDVLWTRKAPEGARALRSGAARSMRSMLRSVVESGTGTAARLVDVDVAGKTGTTQDYRDAWFAGYTPERVAVAWMGKDDFSTMHNVTGGSYPAGMWARAMASLHGTVPVQGAPKPLVGPDGRPEPSAVDDERIAGDAPGLQPQSPSLVALPPARRSGQGVIVGGQAAERATAPQRRETAADRAQTQDARAERLRRFRQSLRRSDDSF